MNQVLAVVCGVPGHRPVDADPTGGDPWLGGPVAITVCSRCGVELDLSPSAVAFNAAVEARGGR